MFSFLRPSFVVLNALNKETTLAYNSPALFMLSHEKTSPAMTHLKDHPSELTSLVWDMGCNIVTWFSYLWILTFMFLLISPSLRGKLKGELGQIVDIWISVKWIENFAFSFCMVNNGRCARPLFTAILVTLFASCNPLQDAIHPITAQSPMRDMLPRCTPSSRPPAHVCHMHVSCQFPKLLLFHHPICHSF